jgi:hypothetical protein
MLAALTGCAGRAWNRALREDTAASYYRFMRDHPNSPSVAEAQEHLDFLKLKRDLTLQGFEAFSTKYPDSLLSAEVRPLLEPQAFDAARAAGTVAAYESFLQSFPSGSNAARARGNAAFLEARGFGGRSDALATFAKEHPASDFAAEARKSAQGIRVHAESQFRRVGLSIKIAAGTPDADRIRQLFLKRTKTLYEDSNVEVVIVPSRVDPKLATRLPKARLIITHREFEVTTQITNGELSRPGMVGQTLVKLVARADAKPIFEREFSLRVDLHEHIAGSSVLFSSSGPYYWDSFFVPVATWQSTEAVRDPLALSHEPVAIDAAGDRVVVLYEDGRFQLIELADPANPVVLSEYVRPKDHKKWSGVRILGDEVAIFGEEGIERVGFGPQGPQPSGTWARNDIGTVFSLEPLGGMYVVAGARGLMLTKPETRATKRIMRRVMKGLAVVGDSLVFTDGESVFISNLKLLEQKRVIAQLRLGKTFAPERVRSFGNKAVAVGRGGVLVMDLSNPKKPVVTAKLYRKDIGRVTDAAAVGNRIFLVGDRGIQMMDARATQVVESIDVKAHARIATMGRHVVSVGDQSLQVVDATPFTGGKRGLPAAGR